MSTKRKAASPIKVGNQGKTASETCQNDTQKITNRQRVKRFVVWLAVHGLVPPTAAVWIISRGGFTHD